MDNNNKRSIRYQLCSPPFAALDPRRVLRRSVFPESGSSSWQMLVALSGLLHRWPSLLPRFLVKEQAGFGESSSARSRVLSFLPNPDSWKSMALSTSLSPFSILLLQVRDLSFMWIWVPKFVAQETSNSHIAHFYYAHLFTDFAPTYRGSSLVWGHLLVTVKKWWLLY